MTSVSRKPMKTLIVAITFISLAAAGITAQGMTAREHEGHGDHAVMQAQPDTTAALIEGLVKRVDKQAGTVTVSHGPLPNGMPAMTMAYAVKDAAWLDQVKAGDKIRFMEVQVNGVSTITRFEQSK